MTRVPGLDALRGLAIVAVFLFHASIVTIFDLDQPSVFTTLGASLGWIGVDLFFAISGFLITRIALNHRGSEGFYRSFWFRRCLRIVPPYYALLVVVLASWPALLEKSSPDQTGQEIPAFAYWVFLSNAFMAQAADHGLKPLSITWSLAVEMQFYLLWPIIVRALSGRALTASIYGLLLAAFVGRIVFLAAGGSELAVFVLLPFRCDALLGGALAACLVSEQRPLPSTPLLWGGALLSGALLTGGLLSGNEIVYGSPSLISLKYSLVGILSFCLLSLVLAEVRIAKALSMGALLPTIGRYSYGLYLIHYAVLLLLAGWLYGEAALPYAFPVLLFVGALISVAVALFSWVAIEGPALRLKRLIPYGSPTKAGSL